MRIIQVCQGWERAKREIYLQDEAGTIPVTLWGGVAEQQYSLGQRVLVVDALAMYSDVHKQIVVKISYADELKFLQVPQECDGVLEVVLFSHDLTYDISVFVVGQDRSFTIQEEVILLVLGLDMWDEDVAFTKLPIDVTFVYQGNTVSSMKRWVTAQEDVLAEVLSDDDIFSD